MCASPSSLPVGVSSGGRKPVLVTISDMGVHFLGVDIHKDGVEAAILHELVDRERLADDFVGVERDAEVAQSLDLARDDLARQAEARDAVLQDAAHDVQRLVDDHLGAGLGQVGRSG